MFRFTIRDLLWLIVLMAMGLAWWIDHRRQRMEIDRLFRDVIQNISVRTR